MSIREGTGAFERAWRALRRALIPAALSCALIGSLPALAHAEGGVTFVGVAGADAESVSPAPATAYTLSLKFDKNVGYANPGADTAFIEENVQKVHLLDARGNEVEGCTVRAGNGRDDRRIIYVQATEWLKPLSTYTVHIDAGIQAANGTDVSAQPYDVTFRTSAECPNGLTLYQNVLIPACILMLAAGVVVMVIRTRREQR